MVPLLWVVGVVLVGTGIVVLLRSRASWGIALIVAGLAMGPLAANVLGS